MPKKETPIEVTETTEVAAVAAKKEYKLDSGEVTSRAGYVRQEFLKDRGRKEIAEELKVPYNVVFGATANMFNKVHPEDGGGPGRGTIAINPDTGESKARKEVMREMFKKGYTRAEIAAHFKTAYGSVYSATKDLEAAENAEGTHGGKVMITDPTTNEPIARIDFIRREFAAGKTRREIANAAGCDYSVVWMSTKPAEKAAEAREPIALADTEA